MGYRRAFPFLRLPTFAFAGLIFAAFHTSDVFAAAAGVEEITVTAQRTEENIQDVPIAVSAFTGAMLADKQIINTSDLQLNTPNMSFTVDNFGGSNVSIRGVGALVIAASGTAGVSFHINEIAMPTNLPAVEFYDMERVEVLRGPQGTLYGRNATGGVIDMVTAKPNTDAVSGNIDMEYGSYADERYKGALNIPITDNFAIRAAGMHLKRDGFIENTANGQTGCARGTGPNYGNTCSPIQLSGIDDKMDGRDLYTYRITGLWNITENSNLWLMYSKFHENDDKVRITNQVCEQATTVTTGCEPNGFGFGQPSQASGTALYSALDGANVLGEANPPRGFPILSTGFRKQHTDFQPVYDYDEDIWEAKWNYDFDKFSIDLSGGYEKTSYLSQQDYNMDVGYDLTPIPGGTASNPFAGTITFFPTSRPQSSQNTDSNWNNGLCSYDSGAAGIFSQPVLNSNGTISGPCITPGLDQTRSYTYDQSDAEGTYWTYEGKVSSHFDGKFNFILGANYSESSSNGDYYVLFNQGDLIGQMGLPLLGGVPPLYPSFYNNTGGPHGATTTDSTAVFGEVYFQLTDTIKITGGLRWNDDHISTSDTTAYVNAANLCSLGLGPLLGGACDNATAITPAGSAFMRTALFPALLDPAAMAGCLLDATPTQAACTSGESAAKDVMNYYNVSATYLGALAAGPAGVPAAFQSLLVVPPVDGFNEIRNLTGSPDKADWQETTGRFVVDWQVTDTSLLYAQYTTGYKPGGFNPSLTRDFIASTTAAYTFAPEKVKATEIGSKNTLFDNSLVLNVATFYYKYDKLQVSAIANNTAINTNIDATIYGAEVETVYIPPFMPKLTLDVAYSYLNTNIDNSALVDPLDRAAGNPLYVSLEGAGAGATTGVSFVAIASQITPALIDQAYAACAALSSNNPNNVSAANPGGCPAPIPGTDLTTSTGAVIPGYWDEGWLRDTAGVTVSDGLPTDIDGNQLPQSPENKIHVGIAYTFDFSFGSITPRFDYSWQGKMYAREFNTKGDEIDSWDQENASILYTSIDGRWEARAWIRNIQDDENITGKYLTSDTSGNFRNYFLTEPRIYGATVKYAFGAL